MATIDEMIEKRLGEVRIDSFDITFGELLSLYESEEFVIRPDFQRFFRWSLEQRSRLIESILLELPIPQIFVIETKDGVLELIDGLQRISSVIHFLDHKLLDDKTLSPLKLAGCDLVEQLNGCVLNDLPIALRMRIKRAKVRAVVIKRQSSSILRFEMFKRLNTGGSPLSEQEIRNCTARMIGDDGAQFYQFLMDCASDSSFANCVSTLSDQSKEKRGDEELVLRFLALRNAKEDFKGSVVDWLDSYMESVLLGKRTFDYENQRRGFSKLFSYLNSVMEDGAFVRYRGKNPIGGLAPAYFEAVTLGTWRVLKELQSVPLSQVQDKIIETVQTKAFRDNVGSGSNSLEKFNNRIDIIEDALRGLVP